MTRSGYAAEVIERLKGVEGEIQLQRRGREYEIIYNGVFLMATYNGASEQEAVREALQIVSSRIAGPLNVLIGGLGVGYSLREALNCDRVGLVKVAEIEPVVIRWNRDYFSEVNNSALQDPRTLVVENDFRRVLEEDAALVNKGRGISYHVIMVDTDNGSSWLSLPANSLIYNREGLQLIKNCLHPYGAACFWSAHREEDFEVKLQEIFSRSSFRTVLEKTGREGCYYLAEVCPG